MSRLLDLSRRLETGTPVFPGDPPVELAPAGAEPPWRVMRLHLGTHSGTHIDAASHYVPEGRTIDEYPLERFVLDAYVVHLDVGAEAAISWEDIVAQLPGDLTGAGVLLHTGWDPHWGDGEATRHPYLSEDAADRLAASGVTLVGTDALNVDGTARPTTYAHAARAPRGRHPRRRESDRPRSARCRPALPLRLRSAERGRRRWFADPRLRPHRLTLTTLWKERAHEIRLT